MIHYNYLDFFTITMIIFAKIRKSITCKDFILLNVY